MGLDGHGGCAEVHGRVEERRGRRGYTSPGEERDNETGKVVIAHGSVEFCEATPIGLVDEPEESCTAGARRTKTCVEPKHEDASGDFYLIFYERAEWGGELHCPIFSFCSLFSVQQTTSGIGHREK